MENRKGCLEFNVEKLGSVVKGSFCVRPLTIFCGKNNTGKTYAMYALYNFLQHTPSEVVLPGLKSHVDIAIEKGQHEWDFIDWLGENFNEIFDKVNAGLSRQLPRVFNADAELFSKSKFGLVAVKEEVLNRCLAEHVDFRFKMGSGGYDAVRVFKEGGSRVVKFHIAMEDAAHVSFIIQSQVVEIILGGRGEAFLIPAERNGLHLFYRELSSKRTALLHHASQPDFDFRELIKDILNSKYAKPIADYIDWLNDIPNLKKKKSDFGHDVAESVKKLLGGRFDVDSKGDIFFTPRKARGVGGAKIDLHMSSSTVKSLFGLWLFLEHQAKRGDVLMIDEPELNLHPDNQRKLARVIAKLVNSGVGIVLSTHSDYIVREINTLIMLSKDHPNKKFLLEKHGYGEDELLDSGNVSAYLFDAGEIKSMEVCDEEGVIAETFDEVIDSLNGVGDDVYYALRDGVQ